MLKALSSAVALAVALAFAGAAAAEEMSVTVKSYNAKSRTVVAQDGANYTLDRGVSAQQIKAGAKLKLMIEEKAGKKVVTKIMTE